MPSRWSALGLAAKGIAAGKVAVVPHGVCTRTFFPRPDRKEIRRQMGTQLEPDLDHLVHLMDSLVTDSAFQSSAREAGPKHVASHYGWDRVVDQLLAAMTDDVAGS